MFKYSLLLPIFLGSLSLLAQIPQIRLSKTDQVPIIDGDLNEPCWASAEKITLNHLLGKSDSPTQRTEVLLTYDDSTLYIAFICYEDRMDKVVANQKERDVDVWQDDCLEIFLSPEPPIYYHFILNTLGTQQDELVKDVKWNADWEGKVKKYPDRWQAEIAIPFSSFPLSLHTPLEWRANFCRQELFHRELASWAPLEKSFHEPANFGSVVFTSPPPFSQIALQQMKEAEGKWLKYLNEVLLEAESSKSELGKKLVMEIEKIKGDFERGELDPRFFNPRDIELLVSKLRVAKKENAPYIVCKESSLNKIRRDKPYAGKPTDAITIYCARNERRSAQLVLLPLQTNLKDVHIIWSDLKGKAGEIRRENITLNLVDYVEVKQPTKEAEPGVYPDPLLPYSPFDVSLEGIQPLWLTVYVPTSARAGWYEGWLEIRPANTSAKRIKIRLYVFNFSLPTPPTLKTCFLLNTGYLSRYHKTLDTTWSWFESPPQRWGSVFLTEDAVEGKYALTAPPTSLRWSNFLSSYQGTCDENTYVSFAYKSNDDGTTFLLISTPNGNKFFTPGEQEKGKWHRATARLIDCGVPAGSRFGLQFVHDFEGGKHTCVIDDIVVYREKNGEKEILYKENFEDYPKETFAELVRKYRLNMLEHRVSDCDIVAPDIEISDGKVKIDWSKFDEEISFYVNRGLNGFNINWLRIPGGWGEVGKLDPQQLGISAQIIKETEKHLAEKGWLKFGYIYTIDEPSREYFPTIKEIFSFVKENGPHLRRLLTFGYGATRPWMPGEEGLPAYAEIADYVDILVPHSDCFAYSYLKSLKAKGKEIWIYVCISAQKPYPNIWAVDYPGIDHRILFWQCFKYDVEGFLYWCVNYWEKNPWKETQTYPGGNGDGSLLYPGKEGPINSLRWEIIREGIQDYEYLMLLKKKIGEGKAKRWLDGIVVDLTKYTQDPDKLEQRRIEIGRMLESL
ncbi:DUF4091 domain-containing protein [bacterium]|nr:DUF4091 domain-containing protein [bacterium]